MRYRARSGCQPRCRCCCGRRRRCQLGEGNESGRIAVCASACARSMRVSATKRGHGCEPRLSRRRRFRPRACAVAVLASAPRPTAAAVASASVSWVHSPAPAPALAPEHSTSPVALPDNAGLAAASGRARLHSSSPSPPAAVRFRPAPARHNAACAAPASAVSAPAASKSLIAADCTTNIHTVQLAPARLHPPCRDSLQSRLISGREKCVGFQ